MVVSPGETLTEPRPFVVWPVTFPSAGLMDQEVAKSVSHEIVRLSPALMVVRSEVNEVI